MSLRRTARHSRQNRARPIVPATGRGHRWHSPAFRRTHPGQSHESRPKRSTRSTIWARQCVSGHLTPRVPRPGQAVPPHTDGTAWGIRGAGRSAVSRRSPAHRPATAHPSARTPRTPATTQNGRSSSASFCGGNLSKLGGATRLPDGAGTLTSGTFSGWLTFAASRPSGWRPLSFQLIQTVAAAA